MTSLVSLMTGVSPWQHQVLRARFVRSPRPEIPLLAEVAGAAGYFTVARVPYPEANLRRYGLLQGFDEVAESRPIDRASSILGKLEEGRPGLFWFHLREAGPPYERRDGWLPGLASSPRLPRRIDIQRLLRYVDPRLPLPPEERKLIWQLYGHEVAWADRQVAVILRALRASGTWDRSWVILTASQGMELGEHGQVFYAQNLGRASIEVPLLIKLPASLRGSLAITDDVRVSQLRLWATLVESLGERPEPVRAPSLFRNAMPPIVSELYQRDGVNELSLLDGDLQLLWTTRFAAAEPEYYQAQLDSVAGRPVLSESTQSLFSRISTAFDHSLPLSSPNGGRPPALRLERWTRSGTEPAEVDVARVREMATVLQRQWLRHVDRQRTPKEESSLSVMPR